MKKSPTILIVISYYLKSLKISYRFRKGRPPPSLSRSASNLKKNLRLKISKKISYHSHRNFQIPSVRVKYSGVYELGDIGHIVIDIGLGFVTWGS